MKRAPFKPGCHPVKRRPYGQHRKFQIKMAVLKLKGCPKYAVVTR